MPIRFIDEHKLLGIVSSRGGPNEFELALWDTSHEPHPSLVRFKCPWLIRDARLDRSRESNHELPFHGDLSGGIVCVRIPTGDTQCNAFAIWVRYFIALSKRHQGGTVQWSQWRGIVTKLANLTRYFSVLHSQVVDVREKENTPVLYVYDFSCHLKRKDEENPREHPLERSPPTPKNPKQIELRHEGMKPPSQYRFTVTEGGVYAMPVSSMTQGQGGLQF